MFLIQLIVMFVYFHVSASKQVILKWKMSYKQRFFPCVNLGDEAKKSLVTRCYYDHKIYTRQ